jgi:hypothetical protein
LTPSEQKKQAKDFSKRWKNKGYEKGESQKFWIDLLHNVMGIDNPTQYIDYERQIMLDHTSFIDGYIKQTHTLIEQKSIDKDLDKPIKQSDGTFLTPFKQAQRYSMQLTYSDRPRWIVISNFQTFHIYDMDAEGTYKGKPTVVQLKDLEKDYYQLDFLIKRDETNIQHETDVSYKAGNLVGDIYQALLKQYKTPEDEHSKKSINQLVVRIVFCLYAEDADIFGRHNMFHDYMADIEPRFWRKTLIDLFKTLDTKIENRDKYIDPKLAEFPYVNGGMFADEDIEIPNFTQELKDVILTRASYGFDWSEISPTIFGAVFESTLNPETRRSGGMHYTSIENIHKVIDPLFLDDLTDELNEIKQYKQPKILKEKANTYQRKLSKLTFFDPACGSGNFLTETYLSLRKLENEAIKLQQGESPLLDVDEKIIKVNIHQFYGIEVNDFAVSVAKTALWIAESQMMEETKNLLYANFDFLPLKSYSNIIEGNALLMDWSKVIPSYDLNYIMGNPPFIGQSLRTKKQALEMKEVFNIQKFGKLDYVSSWFEKSARYIQNTSVQVAFVSTNSITQGEQVPILWQHLIEDLHLEITFARKTFKWNSEANSNALVYCVIIGMRVDKGQHKNKIIYDGDESMVTTNINPYLIPTKNLFIKTRSKPISNVPCMSRGSQPTDGGNLILSENEKIKLEKKHPNIKKYIRPYMMGADFIQRKPRYCLWLTDAKPNELHAYPEIMAKLNNVKLYRQKSKKTATRKKANTPAVFDEIKDVNTKYIAVPIVTAGTREYIPMDYLEPDIIAGNKLFQLPNADLTIFGILMSKVHMAWVRTVCSHYGPSYSYANTICYNNFYFPDISKKQSKKIENTAQAILAARNLYPESTLADLYDKLTMPIELRKAHEANDKVVLEAYGLDNNATESEIVTELFKRYDKLTKDNVK